MRIAAGEGMRPLTSVAVVVVFVLVAWVAARALGCGMALGFSLVASVLLTLVLNLALGGFRRR
jgi:hypothetical protein